MIGLHALLERTIPTGTVMFVSVCVRTTLISNAHSSRAGMMPSARRSTKSVIREDVQ